MIFNGIEKDYVRVNMDLFRPPTPPIEFQTSERRKGGSRTRKKRFTDMVLPVPIVISSDRAIEHLKEELSDWLYHEKPKKLIFKQIPDRYYLAEYDSMELNEKYKYAKGVINFYLAEGYRFGAEKTLNITSDFTNHVITGQVEAPWTSTTKFAVPQSQFTIESNTGEITLNYEFKAGDVLEISYKSRDIFVSGIDINVGLSLESVWFDLKPGRMQLRASHPTTLKYDERYH